MVKPEKYTVPLRDESSVCQSLKLQQIFSEGVLHQRSSPGVFRPILSVMRQGSVVQLSSLTQSWAASSPLQIDEQLVQTSGKFLILDRMLPALKKRGHKVKQQRNTNLTVAPHCSAELHSPTSLNSLPNASEPKRTSTLVLSSQVDLTSAEQLLPFTRVQLNTVLDTHQWKHTSTFTQS